MAMTFPSDRGDIKIIEIDLSDESMMAKFKYLRIREGWGAGYKDIDYYLNSKRCSGLALLLNSLPIVWVLVSNLKTCCFVGSFITEPEYRGRGYGGLLLQHLASRLGSCPLILYSVPRVTSFYEKNGFHLTKQILRRVVFSLPEPKGRLVSFLDPLTSYELNKLVAFDSAITLGLDRENFLRLLVNEHASVITCLHMDDSKVKGYGILRFSLVEAFCRFSIYAVDHHAADIIMKSIIAECHHKALRFSSIIADIPEEYIASFFGVAKSVGFVDPILQDGLLCTMVKLAALKDRISVPFFAIPSMPIGVKHCAVLFMEAG